MRELCLNCLKAKVTCYCALLEPFDSEPGFVILAHPRELRNRVGTGRMLHLSISNSILIDGHDFTDDARVNQLIADPALHCVLLYPGVHALDLSGCTPDEAKAFTPPGKKLLLFIVDGTWELARGMINRSANLRALPQLRFTPERRSAYEFRRQPVDYCLSTVETAHWILERFAVLGLNPRQPDSPHESLLRVFGYMVRQQVAYSKRNQVRRLQGPRLPASPL